MVRASFLIAICLLLTFKSAALAQGKDDIRYRWGNIEVRRLMERLHSKDEPKQLTYYTIYRDHIDFGHCFEDAKFRRLPTTYYHSLGPLGLTLQKFNWFPGPVNTYHADARLPASLTALGSSPTMLPTAQLVALWSEPPVAVIGMNTGTVASYARPFQHFHFYEPTKEVIELNEGKHRFFHFLPDARSRGAGIQVLHGLPRKQLREHGPEKFYQLMILEACSGENGEKIFLEFFTKEGIAQCLTHLADDGILCVHTSHRFVTLPRVLAAIGKDLKVDVRRGHDMAPGNRLTRILAEAGHFSSEWVLLSRNQNLLDSVCKAPANYEEMLRKAERFLGNEPYWSNPEPLEKAWTDKGPNLLHGVLRGHPFSMRYSAVVRPVAEFFNDKLPVIRLGSFSSQRFLAELSNLPRPVEEWMVQWQLKNRPEVEKLWP
jgi:hypothetical protein